MFCVISNTASLCVGDELVVHFKHRCHFPVIYIVFVHDNKCNEFNSVISASASVQYSVTVQSLRNILLLSERICHGVTNCLRSVRRAV